LGILTLATIRQAVHTYALLTNIKHRIFHERRILIAILTCDCLIQTCQCSSIAGTSDGLIAYYTFVRNSPLLDMAYTLGNLEASGSPSFVSDCPGPPTFQPWPGSLCAKLTSTSDSSGGGQYFRVNSLNLGAMSASNGFSLCTWFVFDVTTPYARIFDFGVGESNNNVYLARMDMSPNLFFAYYSGSTMSESFTFPIPIVNGQWRHVCVVNKGKEWSFYDNGAFTASQTASFSLSNVVLTSNYIGRSNWNHDSVLIGRVDEFKIYRKMISSGDVASIYIGMSGERLFRVDPSFFWCMM
jgi:hypothetical protein